MPSFSLVLLKVPLGHHNFHPYYDVLFFFHFSRKVISLQLATSTMTRSKKNEIIGCERLKQGNMVAFEFDCYSSQAYLWKWYEKKSPWLHPGVQGRSYYCVTLSGCNAILLWFVFSKCTIIPSALENEHNQRFDFQFVLPWPSSVGCYCIEFFMAAMLSLVMWWNGNQLSRMARFYFLLLLVESLW